MYLARFLIFMFYLQMKIKISADERTRTADLLITSDNRSVLGCCSGLQNFHT